MSTAEDTFEGKVAVVTGAASGIGLGTAERFADEGMKLVLSDIEAGALEQARKQLVERGAEVLAVQTDVSKAESVVAGPWPTSPVPTSTVCMPSNRPMEFTGRRSKTSR